MIYKVYYQLLDEEIEILEKQNQARPDCLMRDREDRRHITKRITIPPGNYEKIEDLIDELNKWERDDPRATLFKVDNPGGKSKITIFSHCRLLMNGSDIALRLGFDKDLRHFTRGNIESIKSPVVATTRSLDNVYVYTDIVENQHVGDFKVPLLRVVPVRSKFNEINWIHYDKPHYMRLSRGNINSIEINIRDETGEYVSFESGKAVATLAFKRISAKFYE